MQLSATTKPESGGLTADGSTKRVLVAKEEYIRLRWAAAYWKAQHAGAVEREKQLKSENLSLRARVRELESQLWGRKSEQAKGGRAGSSSPKASGRPRGQQKGKQGHGRTTLDGLAAQEEVVDLEEAQKSCPKCGLALEALGWTEDAEVAEIEVRAHRRVIRRRKYKAACRCGVLPGIVTAPAPARLIPKGKLGISVWVEILLEKFDHCRPTHRLLQQWRDHGLTLSAGTVAGGLKKLQGLFLPVAEAIAQQQLTQENWQADETGWPVFVAVEGKSGRLWHLWVFLSASTVVYQLQPSRSSAVPQSHFGSAQGTLLTDRYSAYKKLVRVSEGRDWRQLEFPATTNGIPRFFRADPDHEGMVKDQQVRRLVKLKKNEKTLTMAAAKAGMSRKTARKYLKSGKLPSQCQPERYWRTRSDPFESVWPEVKEILKRSPTVEAKAVFDHLCRQQEGAFQQGQLRTLQRRIKQWKAEYGEAKEVMFPQKYQPGHQAQSDFTFMGRLGVTIQGQPFPHLLYHFVLAYSNWEATTLCFSESFESLSLGLQNALWELGALPEEHRTDRLSAAVKNLKREEFTERYQALLRHFGMRSSRTQAGKAHENGDVEQSHHRLKRAIEQELLLRCSRDFSSREEYEGFVAVIVSRRNAARQKRLGEELAVMRPLPARRLDDFTRQWVRVSPSSTIRVRHNTYSVDSRLIGERVQVRVWADQVEVYYGGRRQARMPRLRGEGKHRIDYRHVIHSLVRKPGAFTRYRWREDLFPGILFRVAYDELRRDCPATADRQYLKILEVAAQEGEQRVREALQVLIERGQRIRFEALRECLVDPVVEPWEVMVEKMDVGLYDTLLENREVRS